MDQFCALHGFASSNNAQGIKFQRLQTGVLAGTSRSQILS